MKRITISITDEQYRRLLEIRSDYIRKFLKDKSISEIVREMIDKELDKGEL